MPDEEETRLRAILTDCHALSLAASYALTHVPHSVANDNDAYQKLVQADATASEQYTAARAALKAYRTKQNLIYRKRPRNT
jgi:hypothetical protein